MVDAVISVAGKVVELLVVPIGKVILYPFKYKSNMEELQIQVEKLTNAKERVQQSVNEANRQGEEIENVVQGWLKSVDEFTDGVVKPIIDDDQVKAGKLCSFGFCPNLMARYSLSRKAAKTTEKGADLLGELGDFHKVSYRCLPLRKTTSIYNRGYKDFDSRNRVFNDLMKAVTATDVNLIGVYGMGGVGKTTLVRRVAAQAIEDKLFDVVVIAEVTEAPDIREIQGKIADELGLKFQEESLSERADRLRNRLKKEKRILIILDNVWEKLDLDLIGIPLRGDEKVSIMQKVDQEGENDNKRQCKLLLTSRSLDVLRNDMDTKENFKVEILSDADAESLFWKTVGYSEEKSDLNPIALEVVGKCGGLPVAIKTVANALKHKSLPSWKIALDELERANPKNIEGMEADVYSSIELSFKFLEREEAKSLFLLCSLCNTRYGIRIDNLLQYGMGLGLFQDAYTLEEGRIKLHMLIDYLKTSCLLMNDDVYSNRVKMHDIVHAVAVSIASTTKLWFILQDSASLKETLEKKLPKDSAAVSIPYRDIYELPERMEFPKLELFLLYTEDDSLQIPDAVFEGMKGLKVLSMTGIRLLSPPSSLCCLINLHTLCLVRCQLEDVSIIGELKELEILSFLGSDIEQLPGEIGQLSRLRLLDLSDCSKLKVIKPNVISSLTCLEELYTGNSFVQWDVKGRSNASLAELKQLSRLTALDIHVLNAEIIPQDLSFGKLERYQIFIGDVWVWSGKSETSKMLKLQLSSSIYLRNEIKSLLNRTEDLYLDKQKGVKNVVYELNREGFQQLKHLHVQNGSEVMYIAKSIEWGLCNVFPRLESLFLDNLMNLEKICHGQLATMSFNKLQILKVSKCDRLKHLFPFSMANNLLQLQEIEVADCKKLEEIILKESEELIQVESIQRIEFTQLRTLTLECLPQLTSLGFNTFTPDIGSQEIVAEDESCGFTSLFSQNVVLPRLENLKLSSITVQSKWLDQLPVMSSCCQALTNLTLEECNGLKFLFSYSVVQSLVLLQKLEILNCKSFEGIINTEELKGMGKTIKMVFPKLYHLRLEHLPKLTSFCNFVGNLIELPSLAELLLENCPKMHAFVSNSPHADTVASMEEQMNLEENFHSHVQPLFDKRVQIPNLKSLRIDKMDNMRKIWHHQLTPDSFSKIDSFMVYDCHNLLNVFPSNMLGRLQKLEKLVVSNCKSVEVIFEELDISSCMVEENVAKEDVNAVSKLVFPRLTSLQLVDLPRLRVLYPRLYILEWPMLKTLRIWGCKKVEKLTSEYQSLQENHGETQHQNFSIQQPLFIVDKVAFPNLEELSLEWNCIAKESMNENFSGNSCKLKDLVLIGASKEAALCLCFFLYKLPNLEKLKVSKGVLEEMFICKGHGCKEEFMAEAHSKLNCLRLWGLNDSLNLGEENSLLCKVFQNLTTLEVSSCNKLKALVSSTVTFQNLTTLEVWKCNGLLNLVAVPIAKSMMNLRKLSISECEMIKEIISHEGDEVEDKIIFKKLSNLELQCLPSLTSFYSGDYTTEFPSLQQVVVRECPNMKTFSGGVLSAPMLDRLHIAEAAEGKGFWKGNLNTTIEHPFIEVPASSIETVIEDEMMRPQQSYTSPLDEYEIQRIHEREGESNVHVKGSVDEYRRQVPIHETVPSQPEVESQMNVKQSVGPIERQMNVLTSGLDVETVIEDEMMRPQQSYTSPLDEYEIQRIHEREGESNVHVKGSVGENRRKVLIHETVPSQPEVESQMNVKQSVGPIERQMNVLTSGLDVETVIEDEMMRPQQSYTSPLDEYEIQRIHEREGESNVHVKGSVGENRRMLPTVPSQHEVESQMNVKQSVGPIERQMNVLTSGLDVKTSTGRTVLKILGYMNDVTAGKVGVHGIGGIGKTSVLEALINHIETIRIFDLIMFVSVSRYWSIRKIQNEVLRQLSLSREDSETDTQVAGRLFQVLSERKFLLLLDDVWEQIYLEAVGIPDPCSVKGSKILMASKNLNVFCDMDVIEVETMSREEAWELFSKQVGGINSPDIQPFAQAIANGCGGLPLLIIVTGKALTGEDNVTVWEHASRKFSLPGTTGTYQTEDVIQLLKFSFDRLRDYDTKSCFLHCSLFSKDREVTIFELIEYCIQEGVIDGSGGDVHKRGLDIVDDLKRASLLQDTKDDNSINMHDLIRDLALGILSSVAEGSQYLLRTGSLKEPSNPASSLSPLENSRLNIPEGYQFLLRAGAGLTEPPSEEEWRQAKMIFLMDNDLCTLPERPSCPELLVLFLQRNYRLRMIPPSFFDSMTSLKVLNLSKTRVKSLPETLFKLEDLQVLILRDCERLVMLPSKVRHLKHLEVLDLQGTEINELPKEIGELTSLRYLKVSFYGSIDYSEYVKLPNELISSGILSRLKALKTLSIVVYPGDQRWCKNVKYVVTDISNLTDLSSLCFHFPEVELLEPFLQTSEAWNSRRLTEFKFVIGHDVKSITSRVPNFVECDYYRQGQCLRFVNGEKISDDVRKVLARSTAFYLDHHLTICSLSDFGVSNINGLKLCIISECPKMETVIDGKELTMTVFPSLENLKIYYLWNLTSIWEGIVPEGSFAGLKVLSVCACPKLKNVFSSSMIDFVSKLEELVVEDCPVIEEIILEGEIIRSDRILLPSLKKLTLHDLPELVNIWKSAWPSLEHISFYNCPKLKKIGWGSELKRNIREIEAEKSWWDELEWEDTDLQSELQDHLATICEDDL